MLLLSFHLPVRLSLYKEYEPERRKVSFFLFFTAAMLFAAIFVKGSAAGYSCHFGNYKKQ
jgi:hypothetical protein